MSLHECAILYIGNDTKKSYNGCHLYSVGGVHLADTFESVDLDMIIDSKLRDTPVTSIPWSIRLTHKQP